MTGWGVELRVWHRSNDCCGLLVPGVNKCIVVDLWHVASPSHWATMCTRLLWGRARFDSVCLSNDGRVCTGCAFARAKSMCVKACSARGQTEQSWLATVLQDEKSWYKANKTNKTSVG